MGIASPSSVCMLHFYVLASDTHISRLFLEAISMPQCKIFTTKKKRLYFLICMQCLNTFFNNFFFTFVFLYYTCKLSLDYITWTWFLRKFVWHFTGFCGFVEWSVNVFVNLCLSMELEKGSYGMAWRVMWTFLQTS